MMCNLWYKVLSASIHKILFGISKFVRALSVTGGALFFDHFASLSQRFSAHFFKQQFRSIFARNLTVLTNYRLHPSVIKPIVKPIYKNEL